MKNSEYNFFNFDSGDCTSRGVCTLSPGIVSLQELVLHFIKLAAFYIVRLSDLGLHNHKIEDKIINDVASLIYINEYNEKQVYELAIQCYYIFLNSKNRYKFECSQRNIIPDKIDELIDFDVNYTLSKSISFGDILVRRLYSRIPAENRNISQILFTVLKSACQNISKLFDFNIRDEIAVSDVLNLLNKWYQVESDKVILSEFVNSFSILDSRIQLKIANALFTDFGKISDVTVSHSTRKGKCILVSGNNFSDLMNILEITKDKNIDIYTHAGLLISHSLEKFRNYPNLKGHYGRSSENCIVDYGTFPGAILLTKNSKNNTEYLYRGKIFSNDYITPLGVIKVENNDYRPLIQCALTSIGFKKGRQKPDSNLGFNNTDLDVLFNKLLERLDSGKIRRLYIAGINSFSEVQKEYFDVLFENIRTDEFALSFYYEAKKNNVVTINIGNYVPLATYVLSKLLSCRKYLDKMYFIFPTCDTTSISGIIKLKNIGAKNIYIATCSPKVINPSVFQTFINKYNVKVSSNPQEDLKQIRKNTSR